MPPDAPPDPGLHRALQGAPRGDRAPARSVRPLYQRPVRSRAPVGHRGGGVHDPAPPPSPAHGDLDVLPAEADAVRGDGSAPAEDDALFACHLHLHVLGVPDGADDLLAGEQPAFHRTATDPEPEGRSGKGGPGVNRDPGTPRPPKGGTRGRTTAPGSRDETGGGGGGRRVHYFGP